MSHQKGFTLVEISIVLVIVGLILGGVLKGQVLIDSARVRSVINDLNGIRSAWYGFQDRFHAVPGDFSGASAYILATASDGDGDGAVASKQEIANVWQHLSKSGFISGEFDGDGDNVGTLSDAQCGTSTCPQNPYYGFYKYSFTAQADASAGSSNELYTGAQIPSSVLFEVDTKIDDGIPNTGQFRVHKDFAATCTADGRWKVENETRDCAAVLLE